MTMPEISLTATDPVSGREDTIEIGPADLVSVILPLRWYPSLRQPEG